MLKIGLTGGIGSGKTTVSKIFEVLEIPVYNADIQASLIMNNDKDVKRKIVALFGENIYISDNQVDKVKLASLIFNDKLALSKINEIVHAAVLSDYLAWIETLARIPYSIMEAAILFESGTNLIMDAVIMVNAPEDIRINRVINRDKTLQESVKARISNQMNDVEKSLKCDYQIINDDKSLVIPQVLQIHEKLMEIHPRNYNRIEVS